MAEHARTCTIQKLFVKTGVDVLAQPIIITTAPVELHKIKHEKRVQGVDPLWTVKLAERQALTLASARYGGDGDGGYEYAKAKGGCARVYNYQDITPWRPETDFL